MSQAAVKRLSASAYIKLCADHFRRYWHQYTIPIAALFVFQLFFRIDVNLSDSLPDKVFLTVKGYTSNIQRGDYVTFEWPGGGPYPKGFHFVKIVAGQPGDTVRIEDRNFYINTSSEGHTQAQSSETRMTESYRGRAKTHSKKGIPLELGPSGVIPEGHYYVHAPHLDSLDSRYAMTGWIPLSAIQGKTYAVF